MAPDKAIAAINQDEDLMSDSTKKQIDRLNHRFAALSMLVVDAMAILANVAPDEFDEVLSRHRMLVQAVEDGTFQAGDASLLESHRFIREILEKAEERSEEYILYAGSMSRKLH
jgi:hypothetical protein